MEIKEMFMEGEYSQDADIAEALERKMIKDIGQQRAQKLSDFYVEVKGWDEEKKKELEFASDENIEKYIEKNNPGYDDFENVKKAYVEVLVLEELLNESQYDLKKAGQIVADRLVEF